MTPKSNRQRAKLNKQLLACTPQILSEWLSGEVQGDEFVALNPTRPDKTLGSFKISLRTGAWNDFAASGFSGRGLVSLYMRLNQQDEDQALDALNTICEALDKSKPATARPTERAAALPTVSAPPPDDCHLPPDLHPDLGEPTRTWTYRIANGDIAFMVYRFDTDKGKETRPISFNPDKQDWQWKLPAEPLPLYQLDRLTDDSSSPVVVVEGEKAADAATTLFPDCLATTSASGSSNAHKSDWSPLYEREVTLVPDADEPGLKYAKAVSAELLVNGSEVFVVDTLAIGWTDGDDVADYPDLDPGWLNTHRTSIRDWKQFKAMDGSIVEAVARLSPLDYDRRKDGLVELLGGVNKRTLDNLVKQAKQADADAEETESDADRLFSGEEPWPEPVDGKNLIAEIEAIIRSHVILSAPEAFSVALWILGTYVFRAFRVCPRLLVSSPEKRCGKTTLLETIQAICFRGLAAANISAAALFRGLEAWSPTLLIDEADTFLHGNDELRGILNSGHTKSTAFVIRTVGDDHEPKLFTTFAPIAIGMIKRPPDTLLDRSIVIRLQRKLGTDPFTALPLEAENEYLPVRQKCLRWMEDNIEQLQGDRELTPSDVTNDRARDNWVPLSAIAEQCGLLAEAQTACRQLTLKEDDSLTMELLGDIQQIFREEGKDKLPSKVLVKKLVGMEERPWSEYQRGKELTQNRLAQLLKDFDVHTHQVREGAKNLKHYLLKDLKELFDRYLAKNRTPTSPETTPTPLQIPIEPDKSSPLAVAGDVAVAVEAPSMGSSSSSNTASAPMTNGAVAVEETLPLQPPPQKTPAEQGDLPGSGVAVQKRGQTNTSTNQEGT